MRNILVSTFIIALALLATTLSAVAQTAQGKELAAVALTGATEVPGPGDSDGSGTAKLTLNPGKGEVCYELTVANIQEATAAHIHEGAVGKAGPVKVGLDAPKTGTAKGCKNADAAVVQEIMQNPANYYVNVHNAEFPQGAVRGQLSK
jgi:CHRD domain